MQKIQTKDQVMVIAGKDKGKRGKVLNVIYSDTYPKKVVKAVVEGVNLVKKHKKGDPSKNSPGAIITKEMPIAISNLALINPATNKADKVGFKFIEKDQLSKVKIRYFKSNQEVVVDGK